MVQSLTVYYLHVPSKRDSKLLPTMENGLSEAFRRFCRDTFDTEVPRDYPTLKLVTVFSADELDKAIFGVIDSSRHFLSLDGQGTCLFLIDDTLMASRCDGLTLRAWFRSYFPTVPKVVITYPGHVEVAVPMRRWVKKPHDVFWHPLKHRERIEHLFKSFWMPRFWSALRQYVGRRAGTNWHTPGHNGGNAFERSPFLHGFHDTFGANIFRNDLSVSVESLGDLSSPESRTPLSEAQKLTSEIFGTAQSCYVTNGTSTSNKAMLMTLLRPSEVVLIDRNCHKSVHHAVVMSGAVPHYLPAHYNERLGVWSPVTLSDIQAALDELKGTAKLLILTTCTYEGVLYPVWKIADMCERAGTLFYADEAWAPYLNFHPYYTSDLPDGTPVRYSAVNEVRGAHFSVQSSHKALAAFSQASMIHVSMGFKALLEDDGSKQFRWLRKRFSLHGRGSYEKFSHNLHEILRYWHSTSPHYPFMATLDTAGVQMRLEGLKLLEERLHWVASFKQRVSELLERPQNEIFAGIDSICRIDSQIDWTADGYMHDPLKLILILKNPEACDTFKKELRKAHIQWEKSSSTTVLFLVTVGTVEEHFEYLFRVVRAHKSLIGMSKQSHPARKKLAGMVAKAVSAQPVILPHDAALCDGELVPIEESVGRIASQFLVPYPPGIPVFVPGMRITDEMVALIKSVLASDGASAVHGLFCRGNHAPYLVEVLCRDEERRLGS